MVQTAAWPFCRFRLLATPALAVPLAMRVARAPSMLHCQSLCQYWGRVGAESVQSPVTTSAWVTALLPLLPETVTVREVAASKWLADSGTLSAVAVPPWRLLTTLTSVRRDSLARGRSS